MTVEPKILAFVDVDTIFFNSEFSTVSIVEVFSKSELRTIFDKFVSFAEFMLILLAATFPARIVSFELSIIKSPFATVSLTFTDKSERIFVSPFEFEDTIFKSCPTPLI